MTDEWPDGFELASEAVKNCAESIVADRDVDKDTAFAICTDMENKGQLAGGRDAAHAVRIHRGLAAALDTVRRTEGDDGAVTYSNLAILAAGEWTDSATEQTVFYSPEALEKIAADPETHVVDTDVNVNHEHADQLKQVGHFDPDSLQFAGETLFADFTLHGRTQASQDTIGLMDLALETEGAQGAGGPSVEIPFEGEVSEFDRDRGMEKLTAFNLAGLAIVTDSASEDVAFAEQFADRAIAMADADASGGVRVMQAADGVGQTLKPPTRHDGDMANDGSDDEYRLEGPDGAQITIKGGDIDAIQDAIGGVDGASIVDPEEEEEEHDLQGEDELQLVAGLLGEYLAENDPDAPATQFVQFVEAETDADPADIQGVLEAYLAEVGADSLEETPVSGLQGYVEAELEEQGDGGDGEEDDDAEMAEKLAAVEDENAELREELAAVRELAESVASEPADPPAEADEPEERPPAPAAGGIRKRGDYISW